MSDRSASAKAAARLAVARSAKAEEVTEGAGKAERTKTLRPLDQRIPIYSPVGCGSLLRSNETELSPGPCDSRISPMPLPASHLFPATLVAGESAFAAGVPGLLARPLMGRALLMRRLAALAGNLTLLGPIHRRKSAVFLGHCGSSSRPVNGGNSFSRLGALPCRASPSSATAVPRNRRKLLIRLEIGTGSWRGNVMKPLPLQGSRLPFGERTAQDSGPGRPGNAQFGHSSSHGCARGWAETSSGTVKEFPGGRSLPRGLTNDRQGRGQAGQGPVAAEELEHLEQSGTDRAAGHRNSRRMDQSASLEPVLLRRRRSAISSVDFSKAGSCRYVAINVSSGAASSGFDRCFATAAASSSRLSDR